MIETYIYAEQFLLLLVWFYTILVWLHMLLGNCLFFRHVLNIHIDRFCIKNINILLGVNTTP